MLVEAQARKGQLGAQIAEKKRAIEAAKAPPPDGKSGDARKGDARKSEPRKGDAKSAPPKAPPAGGAR